MKTLALLLSLLIGSQAFAETIQAPNIPGYVTGTQGTGSYAGHTALDVNLLGSVTIGSVNQGNPGLISSPWFVEPTDGTNHATYTAGGSENVNITNSITATNPSVSATGAAVPGSATYFGVKSGANLVGLSLGQSTMANSLSCSIASDQSAVPVSGTVTANIGTTNGLALDATVSGLQVSQGSTTSGQKGSLIQGAVTTSAPSYTTAQTSPLSLNTSGGLRVDGSGVTQPVSAAALPLPSGAATSALQTSGNSTLSTISGQLPASLGAKTTANSMAVNIASDQTVPISAASLPLPTGAATSANQTTANTSLSTIATNTGKGVLNSTPSFATAAISAVTTVTAPANTVEVVVQALDTNTANLRVVFGGTASATNGIQLEPGRSETFHVNANASICPESGTQTYNVQWIAQ